MSNGGWRDCSIEELVKGALDGKEVKLNGSRVWWNPSSECVCYPRSGIEATITKEAIENCSIRDQFDAATNVHHSDDEQGAVVRAHMVKGGVAHHQRRGNLFYSYQNGRMKWGYGPNCPSWGAIGSHDLSGVVPVKWTESMQGAEWEIIPLEPEYWDFAGNPGLTSINGFNVCFRYHNGRIEHCDARNGKEWQESIVPNRPRYAKEMLGREATREEVANLPDLTDEQWKRYGIPKRPLNDAQAKEWCNHNPGKVV
ncbi:MAG TPA: hypothetical protein VFI02_16840, partial [Armatimonadota bacterium]|nr:hypothetical protein [Armatimonadota bacterium]